MGLDMYLYLKKQTYASDFNGGIAYPKEIKELEAMQERRNFKSASTTIAYQVGYWRKANAIHKWFVDICGNGEDDCREYEVGWDNLKELRTKCLLVLNDHNKAKEELPTENGFFFGTTNYDDWYYEDLQYTVDLINKLLETKTKLNGDWYITYQASW